MKGRRKPQEEEIPSFSAKIPFNYTMFSCYHRKRSSSGSVVLALLLLLLVMHVLHVFGVEGAVLQLPLLLMLLLSQPLGVAAAGVIDQSVL